MAKFAVLGALAVAATAATAELIPNRYIIKLKPGASLQSVQSEVQSLASSFNFRENTSGIQNALDQTVDISDNFRAITGEFTPEFIEELKARGDIEYIENEEELYLMGRQSNPPSYGLSRISQRDLSLPADYLFPNQAGKGVTVYVIDSGVMVEHPDFGGRARWGAAVCPGCPEKDDNGHGTHCAGTIAGKSFGVAKNAEIVAVKACNAQGRCPSTIQAIEWVAKNAKPGVPSVVSMSLGGAKTQATNDAVQALIAKGITVVAAAGNESKDACNTSPCTAEGAVCVGATDKNDALASYSNFGKCVSILAPGSAITSAWNDGKSDTISGTSMATPHVAGAAALLLSQSANMSPAEVKAKLLSMATPNKISNVKGSPNLLLFNGAEAGMGGGNPGRPTTTSANPRPTATATTRPPVTTTRPPVTTTTRPVPTRTTTRPAPRPTTTGICTPWMRIIGMC